MVVEYHSTPLLRQFRIANVIDIEDGVTALRLMYFDCYVGSSTQNIPIYAGRSLTCISTAIFVGVKVRGYESYVFHFLVDRL